MIDIEKVREGLENKILYTRGMFDSHHLGSYYYDVFDVKPIIESLTELERLQKRDEDVRAKLIKRIELNKQILQDEPDVEIEAENTALEMVMMLMNWSDEK